MNRSMINFYLNCSKHLYSQVGLFCKLKIIRMSIKTIIKLRFFLLTLYTLVLYCYKNFEYHFYMKHWNAFSKTFIYFEAPSIECLDFVISILWHSGKDQDLSRDRSSRVDTMTIVFSYEVTTCQPV